MIHWLNTDFELNSNMDSLNDRGGNFGSTMIIINNNNNYSWLLFMMIHSIMHSLRKNTILVMAKWYTESNGRLQSESFLWSHESPNESIADLLKQILVINRWLSDSKKEKNGSSEGESEEWMSAGAGIFLTEWFTQSHKKAFTTSPTNNFLPIH